MRGHAIQACGALLAAAMFSPAAASDFPTDYTAALEAGHIDMAAGLARAEIDGGTDAGNARFALGTAQFLGAVEGLLNGLYRFGLASSFDDSMALNMAGLPFLRMPVPMNPNPETVSYEGLRGLISRFGDDLAIAETSLAEADPDGPDLPLDLAAIHFDVDGDGASAPGESLIAVLASVAGPAALRYEQGLPVDADPADAAWLQAYAHLLMAMTDTILAYDWERAFDLTFMSLFPDSFPDSEGLEANDRLISAQLQKLQSQLPQEPDCSNYTGDEGCQAEWMEFYADPRIREMDSLSRAQYFAGISDLVAFVHLLNWPVVEPQRLGSALGHLEAMVAASKETWRRVLSETDQSREWIPSPAQQGVLGGLPIDQARVDGWLAILDETGAILQGRKLIPNCRLANGINLRRMFLEPRTLDAVLLVQGSAALPFAEVGPVSDRQTWSALMEAFGGNALAYFMWLN